MSKDILRVFAVAIVMASASAVDARAQEPVRLSLGTGFGATLPIGDAADVLDLGWHAQANLGLSKTTWPVGLRFDVGYHSLGGSEALFPDQRIISGLANIELRLNRAGGPGGFFLAAGPGVYNLKPGDGPSDTEFGIFGGVGYKFAMTNLLLGLEGKFHSIFTEPRSTQLIPFSIVAELPLGR